jgi:KUP system potassium uptake protein
LIPADNKMAESSGPPNGPSDKDGPPPEGGVDRRSSDHAPMRPSEAIRQSEITGFHRAANPPREHAPLNPTGKRLAILSLGALGVVYGDIGTSPLYAMQAAFNQKSHGFAPTESAVYGVLSMIVWSLIIVVAVKYIYFILRADNRGEGGVLSLLALLLQTERRDEDKRRRWVLIALGLFGSALLYGDGMITPAISVLGALQGLEVRNPAIPHTIIVGLALAILVGVFAVQQFGTAKVGAAFGPIMGVWFATIGILGFREILLEWRIVYAINPYYAFRFFIDHGIAGFIVLGAVVLVITGAEALYADMGHFGKKPIRLAWFAFVMPALLLNYFGQGALILRDPLAADNPFYKLAPAGFQIPLIFIAALAAIIASQALISGAFSLTQQSIQLGYSPRMTIVHTSHHQAGQIYIPEVNKLLALGTLLLVLLFRDAEALGSAYGIATTGTMAITSILFHVVATTRWGWSKVKMGMLTGFFLVFDLTYFLSNSYKIKDGGWIPIVIAAGVYTLMSTWKRGRMMLTQILSAGSLPLDLFLKDVEKRKPPRVPGTAVFMTSTADGVPVVLLHHLKHNKVLHGTGHPDVGHHAGGARDRGGRAGRGREARAGLLAHHGELRLHGDAERPRAAALRETTRSSRQTARHHFLSGPRAHHHRRLRAAQGRGAPRATGREGAQDGALAQKNLHRHVPQRALGDGVLRHPAQPGRGAWRAGRILVNSE